MSIVLNFTVECVDEDQKERLEDLLTAFANLENADFDEPVGDEVWKQGALVELLTYVFDDTSYIPEIAAAFETSEEDVEYALESIFASGVFDWEWYLEEPSSDDVIDPLEELHDENYAEAVDHRGIRDLEVNGYSWDDFVTDLARVGVEVD